MPCVLLTLGVALAPQRAVAQVADYYRGTVVNDAVTGQPADLELFVYARTDSSTLGWMRVGKPLGGSGATAVVARDLDSLYFVTVTTAGDTLIWASPQRTGTLEGRYWIKGPNFGNQRGRWRLIPQPRVSKAALLLFAICVGALCVFGLAALSVAWHRQWWAWRMSRMSPTDADRKRLSGIGGWLAWVVIGQSLMALYLLVTVRQAADLLGGTWMLGAAIEGMRPLLFFEAAAHFFQLFGGVFGLILIWRHSPLGPPYWVSMLVLAAVYAVVDMNATSGVGAAMTTMFGPDAADATRGMQDAAAQNGRVIWNAAIWSAYWIRSRRVFVVFGPPAGPQATSAVGADLTVLEQPAVSE